MEIPITDWISNYNKEKIEINILGGCLCCLLKALTYVGERKTCNTGIKEDGKLFL